MIDYLYSWILIRDEERKHWRNRAASLKHLAGDYSKVQRAIAYLKANRLFTLEDMRARLEELESEMKELRGKMKATDRRLKNIAGIAEALQTVQRYQEIHDQYASTFFKKKKEKYRAEHQDELSQYDQAYSRLMKINGSMTVDIPALKAERKKLTLERQEMQEKLEAMKPDLDQLRDVRRCVDRAIQDQEPEHLGLKEQLALVTRQREEQLRQQHPKSRITNKQEELQKGS